MGGDWTPARDEALVSEMDEAEAHGWSVEIEVARLRDLRAEWVKAKADLRGERLEVATLRSCVQAVMRVTGLPDEASLVRVVRAVADLEGERDAARDALSTLLDRLEAETATVHLPRTPMELDAMTSDQLRLARVAEIVRAALERLEVGDGE